MLSINGIRLNERLALLAKIGKTIDGGVTRVSFDPNYKKAETLVGEWMKEAGLSVRIDAVGNLIGKREGKIIGAKSIIIGSHIDTVINGGKYDGSLGVLSGIEIAQTLKENNIILDHALEVISFIEEESTRWGVSTLGSHTMAGEIDVEKVLQICDRHGETMEETMLKSKLDPKRILDAKRNPEEVTAYLEIHIEQGSVLENLNLSVGVVTGIAAQVILELQLKGKAGHAGATPMYLRKDALVAAAQLVLETEKIAKEAGPTCVATVGRLEVKSAALNVVPGEVFMTFDIRDIQKGTRDKMVDDIIKIVPKIASENNLEFTLKETSRLIPVVLPEKMIKINSTACDKLNIPVHKMPSGASHDAQVMAGIVDVGMVFIRSKDGVSHNPKEYSNPEDIAVGTSVLLETVLMIDKMV